VVGGRRNPQKISGCLWKEKDDTIYTKVLGKEKRKHIKPAKKKGGAQSCMNLKTEHHELPQSEEGEEGGKNAAPKKVCERT